MHIFKSIEDVGASDETIGVVLFQNDLDNFLPGYSLDLIFSEFESGPVFGSDPCFLGFISFLFKKFRFGGFEFFIRDGTIDVFFLKRDFPDADIEAHAESRQSIAHYSLDSGPERLAIFWRIRVGEENERGSVALQLLELRLVPSRAECGYRFGQPHGIGLQFEDVGGTLDDNKASGF